MLKPSLPNLGKIKASISKSEVEWKTPTLMLAIITALGHFALFKSLNGRFADGPHAAPQTYVAAASHLLASLFRASLSTALGVAFTQHLWRILRLCPTRISTIEHLYHIRENFLLLAHSEILGAGRLLFAIAALIWLIPVAVIYPPAALTVISSPVPKSAYISISTLDLTDSANYTSAGLHYEPSLARNGTYKTAESGYVDMLTYVGSQMPLNWASKLTLQSGRIPATTSPCGTNCTFSLDFVGPYLTCTESTFNTTLFGNDNVFYSNGSQGTGTSNNGTFDYYTGNWTTPEDLLYTLPNPFVNFSTQVVRPIGQVFSMATDGEEAGDIALVETQQITCAPGKASYTLNTTYTNGIRNLSYQARYLGLLQEGWRATEGLELNDTRGADNSQYWKNFEALNLFAIIESTFQPLTGQYRALASPQWVDAQDPNSNDIVTGNVTISNGTSVQMGLMDLAFLTASWLDVGPNSTVIAETLFNTKRNNQTDPGPNIKITADLLNEALFNVTLGAIYTLDFWRANISALETQYQNVYSFSPQRVLILPYIICLLVALPFLALGWNSLHQNGIPAMDASFVQVLVNTSGSKALRIATAGGCSDRADHIPKELLDLKIQYSDLIAEDGAFKWAGLGTEDEVRLSEDSGNDQVRGC